MTDFAQLLQPDRGEPAHLIHLVDRTSFEGWLIGQSASIRTLVEAARFNGKQAGQYLVLPGGSPDEWDVVAAVEKVDRLSPWCLSRLAESLPESRYRLAGERGPGRAALGWLLGQHRFRRYKSSKEDAANHGPRILLSPDAAAIERFVRVAYAQALVRDLVDTPAADMGPADLEQVAREVATDHGARIEVTSGDALARNFPMIQAVGQGAARERAPRLIEIHWGKDSDPRVAIVGKGVCFDTGGLDIKPSSGMRLMKKDMGGAAHALALARLVMAEKMAVRLHLLVPAVENSVSATAFRPGDVIASRKGLSVEIDNTDAEGRLVLGDALAKACEDEPALVIDFATLTGAARVALGPDLPAFYSNDDELAGEFAASATEVGDPLWRMPLWDGYDEMLKSDIADLANSSTSPFAGSITAALFLRRFVKAGQAWAHFDTFAWSPSAKPGRPKGGEAMGLRASHATLLKRFGSNAQGNKRS